MEKAFKNKKTFLWLSVIGVIAIVVSLAACAPATNTQTSNSSSGTTASKQTPATDDFGVVDADSWMDAYPNEYKSYMMGEDNSPKGKHNYLEMYPMINTLYKGNAFSKGYDEAAGHNYSLDSVRNSPRIGESTLANCLTCKSPQYTIQVNEKGDSEYALKFADVSNTLTEPISCYNCHENDPETVSVPNKFFVTALGSDYSKVPESALACGQCHNEYYFSGDNKATTNPYVGLAAMAPDAILAYYDEKGFSDWKYPVTDTPMIKIQHPEFEMVYGGGTKSQSHMASLGYSCSDCHMGKAKADDGTEYMSHNLISPLDNQELLDTVCYSCHDDLAGQVADWQAQSESRVYSIGDKIADLANQMTAQVEAGTLSGDKLTELQKYHRNAQFYWDFIFVENSEGAHNPSFSDDTLDKAEAAVDAGLAMLA